ncbi:imidazoleglycerol-phosphate dehydratase [Yoonia sp. GPGPB17]|uniref:imidazoleglycerol-phosphate dehydratase n=1 Tax=Yoonia sp. GPGPB17 TaxID=3026147 RepID=UPI0030C55406
MKALILRADENASVATARALIDKGFQILSVNTQVVAHALIRVDTIDLLVMDEQIEGQLTHAIALSGERRNPYLSAILLTDRGRGQTDDLYDLIPSLYGIVGSDAAPELIGKLALSAVSNIESAVARAEKEAAMNAAENAEIAETEPLILAQADMSPPEDEMDNPEPSYADVAIAAPALAEMTMEKRDVPLQKIEDALPLDESQALRRAVMLEHVEDAVSAEVAALFRKNTSSLQVQPSQSYAAKAG